MASEMPKLKSLIVTIDQERSLEDVSKDLADAGLVVGQVLEEIGCITGSAPARAVARLRKVRGVTDVSPDTAIDVGPPGSAHTW